MPKNPCPLEAFNFGSYTITDNELTYAVLKSNKGDGAYSFKNDSFTLPVNLFTGLVDGEQTWLLCTLAIGACNPGGVFEIAIRKQIDGKWTLQKEESEEQVKNWQKSGGLSLINVTDIPVLKALASLAAEYKTILRTPNSELLVNFALTDELVQTIYQNAITFWVHMFAGETPQSGTPAYDAAMVLSQAGVMTLPVLRNSDLPSIQLKDLFGNVTGAKLECFPFEGELPSYDKVTVTPPKPAERKKSGSYGSGATVTTTVTGYLAPIDRAKYICDSLRAMGVDCKGDGIADIAAVIAGTKPAKGDNPTLELVKLAYQMTTDNWILG